MPSELSADLLFLGAAHVRAPLAQRRHGKFIPEATCEFATVRLRGAPSPLLEEEGDLGSCALVTNRFSPTWVHGPSPGTRFTADNHPVDASQVEYA